jgi:hypothetical protein
MSMLLARKFIALLKSFLYSGFIQIACVALSSLGSVILKKSKKEI